MANVKNPKASSSEKMMRPALTPESRENQMVCLAIDLAEKQLRDGTASSQLIHHFVKIGSTKEKIEKEILQEQKKLIEAKTQTLQSAQKNDELFAQALVAMSSYKGQSNDDDY